MEDEKIVELYFSRSEQAIAETRRQYGGLCWSIAYGVLGNREDAEESVSDAFLDAWNSIPPQRPNSLGAYLSRLTRRRAIDKWRGLGAEKRGKNMTLALHELEDCIPAPGGPEEALAAAELKGLIVRFLSELPKEQRQLFLLRYWYLESIGDLAKRLGWSQSKVKTTLFRVRKKLMNFLREKGGVL